jgi:hypothetical protein
MTADRSADLSRDCRQNALARGYSGVVMQQGRLSTDSDWNEAFAIAADRSESATAATMGPSGTLKRVPGFGISAGPGGFGIAAGRYWVDGLRIENRASLTFDAQPGQAPFPAGLAANATALVWLEVWRDTVSATDDRRLADPALGGVDTALREVPRWRVRLSPVTLTVAERQALIDRSRCGALIAPTGTPGSLSVSVMPAGSMPTDDCMIPPEAGYVSQENQLYRVQIVEGGPRATARFVWSRENASVTASLRQDAGQFSLGGTRPDDGLGFHTGDIVEVYDDRLRAQGLPGNLHRLTLTNGIASFAPVLPAFGPMVNPGLRRWDHRPAGADTSLALGNPVGDPVALERGLQVSFGPGDYVAGQFWLFEARAATGQPVWPPVVGGPVAVPAMGGGRQGVALALARIAGGTLADVVDLRALAPSLACLAAEDIRFDDSACAFDATTVQQAIEALCQRGGGLCTVTVRTEAEFRAAIAAVPVAGSIHLCLAGVRIALTAGLVVSGLGHVTLSGAGPQSQLVLANNEAALLVDSCESFTLRDLTVRAGGHGQQGRFNGRMGAVSARNCPVVRIERVEAAIGHGSDRNACAIASFDCAEVTVRDCRLSVGQLQIGVQLINAIRAVIETNMIAVLDQLAPTSAPINDPVVLGRVSRGLLWFSRRDYRTVTDPNGDVQPLNDLRGRVERGTARTERAAVEFETYFGISEPLVAAFQDNDAQRDIGADAIRRVLRGYVARAIRNGGRLDLANGNYTLFNPDDITLSGSPMMAQGIVVAGATVDEVIIRANLITDAQDGIRIAASARSSGDIVELTPQRPTLRIRRAIVSDNRLSVQPVSAVTNAYGITLGSVDRVNCDRNEVAFPRSRSRFLRTQPHHGLHQYGWRGGLFVWAGNIVANAGTGYFVGPDLETEWRGILRDNSAEDCGVEHRLTNTVVWN